VRSAAHVLHVTCTIKGPESRTLKIAGAFFAELAKVAPRTRVTTLDLFATPPPFDTPTLVALNKTIGRAPLSAEEESLLRKWQPWIDRLITSDMLVFTTPLWNYHAPPHLKAFIDIVTLPGKSFRYTHDGPTGVLDGKRSVLLQTRGAWGPDHLGDWLKDCLWLLGGAGLDVVKADKQDLGTPDEREREMARAIDAARALARKAAVTLVEQHA
jgi:FMN-dependent NADH-azoreductase